ncbi:MAG: ABC transporter ATP-binding protein [Porticoccaceae bacterium]|nr:MAG: ABC transporter ATP-binding protein [Porticoccaceae bacterium]
MSAASPRERLRPVVRLLALTAPPRGRLLASLVLLLAGSAATLLNPWFAGQVTAFLTADGTSAFASFQLLVAAWVGLIALRATLQAVTGYALGAVAEEVLARLRARLYEHLQLLPLVWFDERRRGDVLSILTNDAAAVSHFVTAELVGLLPGLLTTAGAAGWMVALDPLLALLVLATLPPYLVAVRWLGRRLRPLARAWVDGYGRLVAHAEEGLGLLPAIKAYTREAEEMARFAHHNRELLLLSKRQLALYTALPAATGLLAGLGLVALVAVGYHRVQAGVLTTPELVSLLFFAGLLHQPLSQLAGVYGQLQRTLGASERIFAFLDAPREPDDHPHRPLVVRAGAIRFADVTFAWPGAAKPVLERLNLEVAPRETVAIVGENGAGKSTLVHLLMRLIEPQEGTIAIDGQDISQVSLASLRGQIGLVAQHTLLLNATVAENIAWGKPLASRAELEAAARAARAHEFIEQLPQGYDTVIGDQGLKLSGGQRQRLALARALLKDPPILVLDEATSMFDPSAEAAFLRDCRALFATRTVLLVTHRPASLAIAHRVLRLAGGRLQPIADLDRYLRTGEG